MRVWLDPEQARRLRHDRRRRRRRRCGAERAGLGRRARRSSRRRRDNAFQFTVTTQGRFEDAAQFREVIVKSTDGRPARARCRTWRASSSARRTTSPTPTSTASRPSRSRIFQRPGTNALARRRPRSSDDDGGAASRLSRRARLPDRLQPDRVHRRSRSTRSTRRCSRRWSWSCIVVIVFLQTLAHGDHPDRRHPGLADRHLRRDGGARLLAQHADAVRPGAGDRHRRRRRHRRGRECRAQHRARAVAARGRARDHGRGRHARSSPSRWCCRAVFVPTAFIPGISGQFYRQFALTIAVSTLISAFNSLTLSPALAALLLKPHDARATRRAIRRRALGRWLADGFNRGFDAAVATAMPRACGCVGRRRAVIMLRDLCRPARRHGLDAGKRCRAASSRRSTRATRSSSSSCRTAPRCRAPTRSCSAPREIIRKTPGRAATPSPSPASPARPSPTPRTPARSSPASSRFDERLKHGPVGRPDHRPAVRHACRASRRPSSSPSRRRRCAASAMPAASRCSCRSAPAPTCAACWRRPTR